ncbi:hypothetical protein N5853_10365 [Bartonella sp. HY329]|uniref:hypothetical protein n=1 Tax=unclassified Bartonella TaxID=2645622 RepID=UPI0021C59548|nr:MULTISPECIES: hypothetical protein [unclassified Bartonella]UXM94502.1 hypothetical protein N5853_10365 [Bartonella sp. HY329]UXN08826.1 hypothetical protein N5852_10375 [Bartonella sp. HY328]
MKYICVPISYEAMQRLNYNCCEDGDLIELQLDEDKFRDLWRTTIFGALNAELGLMIEEFEDAQITDIDQLMRTEAILKHFARLDLGDDLDKLLDLTKDAITFKTGLFFFF